MKDIKTEAVALAERLEKLQKALKLPERRKKIEVLEREVVRPDLWRDPEKAKKVTTELADLKKEMAELTSVGETIETLKLLSEDESQSESVAAEVSRVSKILDRLETVSFLSGEYDERNAIVSIHAGQGGTEAMDWASMLYRMYLRFCERKNWETQTLDVTAGEEAGIKSVTFRVNGPYAYGYLKGEAGTHRLVRQSPFNADRLRQTSFALVEVLPELADVELPDIVIKDEDIEWQFFRSSSQGGQNVQKVSTAVRLIHKPTGITVSAQSERFQEQNRKIALSLLKSKLWQLKQAEVEKEKTKLKGGKTMASWGTQIRSYVLHPYKMVKDIRTGVETSNTENVLNGEIDEFIEGELKLHL